MDNININININTTDAKKGKATSRMVKNTALKTLAVLLLILIMVVLIGSLAAPRTFGDFFYTVGLKSYSSRLTLRSAENTEDIDDFYIAFIRAVDAKNHKVATYSAQVMLDYSSEGKLFTSEIYEELVKRMDTQLESVEGTTNVYIKANYIYSKLRFNKGEDEGNALWNQARSYCKGTSIYYYYNSICPIKSYIDAVIDINKPNTQIVFEIILHMRQLDESKTTDGRNKIWRTNLDNSFTGTSYKPAQPYMAQDIQRLLEAKEITDTIAADFSAKNGIQYLNAYNYWKDILAQ